MGSDTEWFKLDVFADFVGRSAAGGTFTLSSLCIDEFPITDSDCLSLLHLLPLLTELEVNEYSLYRDNPEGLITDKFLDGLCIGTRTTGLFQDQSNIPCLPRLENIRLCKRRDPTFKPEKLSEMVRSRWIPDPAHAARMGVSCLRSIKVCDGKRTREELLGYGLLRELVVQELFQVVRPSICADV
ncbi:hypothetical protein K435DRAFT_871204 [Dendrothele bispora CBS 962.96]|uniref:F-box domain-containing protein n=1 Tax=Dendrothele bispora (strain CBS 962.96) TaxID=1314807 RepID=A0A4S8L622_DENBC|nr:hypothetical protein K435DRAFT_871198 [Dendrothele bispora CBS 962.96]THU83536.1 hypothetical protein K435DRAFT_871204 [Dendrothele bispora CBS 962.96]